MLHPTHRGDIGDLGEVVSPRIKADAGLAPVITQTRLEGTCGCVLPPNALARIDVLEANCDDLRHGTQDALAVAESTEKLLKAAMDHEAEQLWRELRLIRQESTAELQQLGLQFTKQMEGLAQDVHALRESGLKSSGCEAENVEKTQLVEDISLRVQVQDLQQQRHIQAAEVATVQSRLQELERMHAQQHADHRCQPVEEMLLRLQGLEQQLHRQAAEVGLWQPRLRALERSQQQQQSTDTLAAQMPQEQALMELVQSALETRLASNQKCVPEEQHSSSVELQELKGRLLVLEGKIPSSDGVEAAVATMPDIEQLRKSLADTNNDVSMLARHFAGLLNDPKPKAVRFSLPGTPSSQASSDSSASKQSSDLQQLQSSLLEFASRLNSTEPVSAGDVKQVRDMLSAQVRDMLQQPDLQVPARTELQQLAVHLPTHTSAHSVETRGSPLVALMQQPGPGENSAGVVEKPDINAVTRSPAGSKIGSVVSQAKPRSRAASLEIPVATGASSAKTPESTVASMFSPSSSHRCLEKDGCLITAAGVAPATTGSLTDTSMNSFAMVKAGPATCAALRSPVVTCRNLVPQTARVLCADTLPPKTAADSRLASPSGHRLRFGATQINTMPSLCGDVCQSTARPSSKALLNLARYAQAN